MTSPSAGTHGQEGLPSFFEAAFETTAVGTPRR